MRVFVAGATGAVGIPAVRALVAAGHEVTGLTRTEGKRVLLDDLGARSAVGDALDAERMRALVADAKPDAIVQLLTALPFAGPTKTSDLEATNRLRTDGTRALLDAAQAAGVDRFVAESFILGYGSRGDLDVTEDEPFGAFDGGDMNDALAALRTHEQLITAAGGIVLRFGIFYGPEVGSTRALAKMLRRRKLRLPRHARGNVPWLHVDDAAASILAALERGAPGATYNIASTHGSFREATDAIAAAYGLRPPGGIPRFILRLVAPYASNLLTMELRVSTEKAAHDLGWTAEHRSLDPENRKVQT